MLDDYRSNSIQKNIVNKLEKEESKDIYKYVSGFINVTQCFDKYYKILKKNGWKIFLKYDFSKKEKSVKTSVDKLNKLILIKVYDANRIGVYHPYRSLNHEILHIIDFIKSDLQHFETSKKYKKALSKADEINSKNGYLTSDVILPYYKDEKEFNVLINQFFIKYSVNDKFREKVDSVNSYENFLKLLFGGLNYKVDKQLINDKGFKKRLISRICKEGIKLNFVKKEDFDEKVNKELLLTKK